MGLSHPLLVQMRLYIVKLGVIISIYGDFGEETGWRLEFIKRFFCTGSGIRMAYKSENVCVYAESSFCTYIHF